MIERWKVIVEGSLRWSIRFWNRYLKISKFWLPVITSAIKNVSKRSNLVFTNVDRKMKIKSKRYFEVNYSFMNCSLKVLKFWLNVVMSSIQNWLEKGPTLISYVLMVIQIYKCICFCRVFHEILIPHEHLCHNVLGTFGIIILKKCLSFEILKKLPSREHFF